MQEHVDYLQECGLVEYYIMANYCYSQILRINSWVCQKTDSFLCGMPDDDTKISDTEHFYSHFQ